MNSDHIKSTLQESIQHFRDINPDKHSYAYIGMKSNNSTSFVERAAKNKLGVPLDPKKVLPLANLVCDEPQTRQVAKFFADNLVEQSDILKDALYAKFVQENDSLVSENLEKELSFGDNYIAYSLSSLENGITDIEVLEAGGGSVLEAMKDLTSKGFVSYFNNKYHAIKKTFSLSKFSVLKTVFPSLINHYKPSNVGKERNYIHLITNGLNREGIKALQAEHRRHHEAVRKIMKDYSGDIAVFSAGVMDTFTSKDIDNNRGKVLKSVLLALILSIGTLSPINNSYANENSYSTLDNYQFSIHEIEQVIFTNDSLEEITKIRLRDGVVVNSNQIKIQDIGNLIKSIKDEFKAVGGDTGGGKVLDPFLTGDSSISPIVIEYPYEHVEVNLDALNYQNQQDDVIFDLDDLLSDY